MLASVIARYQNRSIETAQVMEELADMARKFREAASRGEKLGLSEDEVRFYDALVNNESAVRELSDETLKKIAHELTENLRQSLTVDWSERESVRARPAGRGGGTGAAAGAGFRACLELTGL
jgi:type I restriction enzyme, R subunit